jgi:ribosomal protein S18 acetylase RimI-like enzyme
MKRSYNEPLMSVQENEKPELSLREVTPADGPFLFEVYASTRMEELQMTEWTDEQKLAFIRMQFMVRERSHPVGEDRIILLDGKPIGRMIVDRGEEAILLRDIAVLTEYRNAGVGSRLIQQLMREAAAAGKPVQLHVVASSAAIRLYERLGFCRVAEESAYLEMKWFPPTN